MGARSRRKGAQAERDLAKRFAEAMPGAECKRGIGQARRGCEVADVEVPYFHCESKHGKRPNPRAAYAQACADAEESGKGKTPIAVIRDDRRDPFVVIGLEDFLRFVGEWWEPKRIAREKEKEVWRRIDDALAMGHIGVASEPESFCAAVGDVVRMAINEERDDS